MTKTKELCNRLIKENRIGLYDTMSFNHTRARMKTLDTGMGHPVVYVEKIAPTVLTDGAGGVCVEDKSIEKSKDNKIKVIGNYMPSNHDASRVVDSSGIAPTVKENHGTVTATKVKLRIRKLTPLECFRLMGFDDVDFEKASKVNSNNQLYKQCGNSIVVNCLEEIFKNLLF